MVTTDEGTLDIQLEPEWGEDGVLFKVIFYDSDTGKIQRHIDFDFSIENEEGEVYRASKSYHLPLHTNSGIMVVPYKFAENGSYVV
ncbi:MAG: hypothetical protein QXX64_05165, partial [Nitrososphaera sp.]